jgi:hypothetical protein
MRSRFLLRAYSLCHWDSAMNTSTRRTFVKLLGASAAIAGAPASLRAAMYDASGLAVAPEHSDEAIATDPSRSEKMQAIAVNPKRPNQVVVVESDEEGGLFAYRSADAGRTWSGPVALPDATDCHFPSADAAYTADGRGVYVAFSNRHTEEGGPRILVTGSDDNGATWGTPVVAIAERGCWGYTRPRLATPLHESDGNWLYITAELEVDVGPLEEIVLAKSADHGKTWTAPQSLARGNRDIDPIFGSNVAGGIDGDYNRGPWCHVCPAAGRSGTT